MLERASRDDMLIFEPPSQADHQPEALLEAWSRARRLGVSPDSDAYPHATSDSDLAERRDRLAEVFREKRALLTPLSEQLAARSLVAVVADPDGVILASHGGGAFDDPAARVRLIEGAKWSEDIRGTNAIGTAIAERQAVAVIGAAHFERRNHGIFCYGEPVFDGYGDLACVLDVTGPIERHDRAVGKAVHAAATSIEQALRRLAYAQSGAGTLSAIERLVHRSSSASLVVEASGRVVVMNHHANQMLGLASHTTCEKIFGLSFTDLHRLLISGAPDLRFEMASHRYRVELDPINGIGARTFAIVVHLEPSSYAPAAPPPASRRPSHPAFAKIHGSDAALLAAKDAAARFARTPLPVLLLAETGTGKELFARAIHGASTRAQGAFVALNCGALTSSVLESELFGHAPNAFTGASRNGADGKIAAANGGTLFLDEIAEMPENVQAALLRVLDEEGAYYRVGDARQRHSDFRLVCATCRDLPKLVEKGAFRRDLFFRIHGACVTLPTLRHRSDRVALAEALLAQMTTEPTVLAESARRWIEGHDWPGNVRELKSALVHALAMADGQALASEHFPRVLVGLARNTPGAEPDAQPSTHEPRTRVSIINEAIMDAVRASAGNVSEAARRLGIARSTVYRVLRSMR